MKEFTVVINAEVGGVFIGDEIKVGEDVINVTSITSSYIYNGIVVVRGYGVTAHNAMVKYPRRSISEDELKALLSSK